MVIEDFHAVAIDPIDREAIVESEEVHSQDHVARFGTDPGAQRARVFGAVVIEEHLDSRGQEAPHDVLAEVARRPEPLPAARGATVLE
jgi:hypothetical protein